MKKKVAIVVGTRPEAIKCSPIIKLLKREPNLEPITIATAQHRELLDGAFADLGVEIDVDLNLMRGGQTLSELTARAITSLDEAFKKIQPDIVLAQGDTTTVMAVALVCFYLKIPFGHVEAGLRTGDLYTPFPEEFNRVLAGKVSSLHFAPTQAAKSVLLNEGVNPKTVFSTGNTGIDTLLEISQSIEPANLDTPNGNRVLLMTAHRRENFGEPMRQAFLGILDVLDKYSDVSVVFPVHPNPNVVSLVDELFRDNPRIILKPPLNYKEFISVMKKAKIIVSDSGGVQEEAPIFGIPVLVMRNETERPEAVNYGVSKLVGTDRRVIFENICNLLDSQEKYNEMSKGASPYGDGNASERIVTIIGEYLGVETFCEKYGEFTIS